MLKMIPRAMGIVPFGIGVSLLYFAWAEMQAPVFFKLFFSFVALAFVMGGVGAFSAPSLLGRHKDLLETAQALAESSASNASQDSQQPGQVGYSCPNCGADLGDDADVSPSGDAKCGYCKRWFNIHS